MEKKNTPPDLGHSQAMMKVIHTHDSSGELHVESPVPYQFYLGDFFKIWQKTFNSSCVLDRCIDQDHTLKVFLNGLEDNRFEALPLHDGDNIKIVYKIKNQ